MQRKGFGFVEIVSQCPESYGRRIGLSTAVDFLRKFKERSIRIEKAKGMSEEELADRIVIVSSAIGRGRNTSQSSTP